MELIPRERRVLAPGAVHVPDWLDLERQRELVRACRAWAVEGPGIRATVLPNGGVMSVKSFGLGWHWLPYRYSRTRDDQDGSPVTAFPEWLGDLGREAVATAYDDAERAASYRPDIALVNYYDAAAKMGLHQDKDEKVLDPVVSLSIGAPCLFRLGGTANRGKPWADVELRSGDLVVFGDESRLAYHGVPKLLPALDVPDTGLTSGRLNITLRVSGLA
ncbi:alpha-ketoglutarate-dependent dioxygenase AlkB family protein [Pseudonocardia sp. GCM10023141]|uniref:alpha-ketoglutarate-dependent dioxygenase AlkB family protein n=1 Tax=Pseudonocardia sp. GCM10023141 TaxID=3252653 RepID=UPI00360BEDF6